MAGASISHALIVAGPSGAGKSAFLRELAAGRLPPEIRRLLPEDAHTWREVYSNEPAHWRPLIEGASGTPLVAGIAVHYDVTLMYLYLGPAMERDPFWDTLQHCGAVTLINIRPTRKRLIRQWIRAHFGVRWLWAARCMNFCAAHVARFLHLVQPLRTNPPSTQQPKRRFPRWLGFLERWERWLLAQRHKVRAFRFYRRNGNLRQMLKSWDEVTAERLMDVPLTHIELAPASALAERACRWRVVTVKARTAASAASWLGALAPLC